VRQYSSTQRCRTWSFSTKSASPRERRRTRTHLQAKECQRGSCRPFAQVFSGNDITMPAAPVSHQKRPQRTTTNAIKIGRKYRKINEADRYPPARNGLAAGSFQTKPITQSIDVQSLLVTVPDSHPVSAKCHRAERTLLRNEHVGGRSRSRLHPFFFATASDCTTSSRRPLRVGIARA